MKQWFPLILCLPLFFSHCSVLWLVLGSMLCEPWCPRLSLKSLHGLVLGHICPSRHGGMWHVSAENSSCSETQLPDAANLMFPFWATIFTSAHRRLRQFSSDSAHRRWQHLTWIPGGGALDEQHRNGEGRAGKPVLQIIFVLYFHWFV